MAPIVYGYWSLRGLAEPIVYLLHHVEADFEVKNYSIGDAPPYNKDGWLKDKYNLGLDFPNLPYLIDGDVRLTQSLTIIRKLARKYKLAGKNEEESTQIDLVEQQTRDLQMTLIQVSYGPDFENSKEEYRKLLPEKFEQLSKYLGDRKWFVGDSLTYVDFLAYEAIDHNRLFAPDIFDKFENLKSFLKNVESLPNIKKYMKSDKFKAWPIFAPMAKFGGKGAMPQ